MIFDFLSAYSLSDPARFHMPGHKGVLDPFDVTELPGADNLLCPDGIITRAMEGAARVYGARRTFFLTGGATQGVLAMLLYLPRGSVVALGRDCHKSAVSGLALGGHRPVFISPPYDERRSMPGLIRARDIAPVLEKHSCAALMVTYPDYLGRCCDLEEIRALCAKMGVPLLVDSAHGAHFPLSGLLPPPALGDAWVCSAHKTLAAPNQSAYLHIGPSADGERMAAAVGLLQTTSPAYPMLAALERACLDDRWTSHVKRLAALVSRLPPGISDQNAPPLLGARHVDPTRLVLDVTQRGLTGLEAAGLLALGGVYVECADLSSLCLITTPDDPPQWYQRLLAGLEGLPSRPPLAVVCAPYPEPPPRVMPLEEALMAPSEPVEPQAALGRICAAPAGAYPPGSAAVVPGEVITEGAVEFFAQCAACGRPVFGVPIRCVRRGDL